MNWRNNLINLFKNKDVDESQFILGIDLGDSTSAICYYDALRKTPEIIDISGGYGKSNMPTALQYAPDSKEWIFGEYAVLSEGATGDISFTNIINRLGSKSYIEIGDKLEPLTYVLSLFLKELLSSCKNINPKAEISGIVVSVPDYMPAEAKNELLRAFSQIGYDKKIIDFVPNRQCVLAYHYHNRRVEKENMVILDFGGRELRGGIYEISGNNAEIDVNIVSYFFDGSYGANLMDNNIKKKFTDIYCANTNIQPENISRNIEGQISALAYQHKDAIFQKHLSSKGMRLYYNFAYPPFYHVFTRKDVDELIEPFSKGLRSFLAKLFGNNQTVNGQAIEYGDISTVLCTGGGFEMLWAREVVEDIFPDGNISFYKNPKAVNSYGASIIAAGKLGVEAEKSFKITDNLQVKKDIGIMVSAGNGEKFYPVIESGSFWWQGNKRVKMLVNEWVDSDFTLMIKERDESGAIADIGQVGLSNLPPRAQGTTQIDLSLEYVDRKTLKISVEDKGFGAFFNSSKMKNEAVFEF
ncbi:DUF5716 family protein [Tyzzerella sp. OttesenSCG-928-J15]|nr:DUF5716 family protein [Tyzzerella sp. OttesenSCG-928-J15]